MAAPPPEPKRARALTGAPGVSPEDNERAIQDMAASGDRGGLQLAREELVRRITESSDDFEATAALGLVNKAIAHVGWPDPYGWKHRRKP